MPFLLFDSSLQHLSLEYNFFFLLQNVEDLPDRHLEILNLLPSRVPTTGAPCTPVTNAPAIYQHNYQTNIQDMGDVIKEPKSIISPCVAKSSAETYIATSTTSSLSNSVACGESIMISGISVNVHLFQLSTLASLALGVYKRMKIVYV